MDDIHSLAFADPTRLLILSSYGLAISAYGIGLALYALAVKQIRTP